MTEIIFVIFKMIVNFKIIKVQNQEHTECTSRRCNYKLPIEPTIAGCRGTLKFKSLTITNQSLETTSIYLLDVAELPSVVLTVGFLFQQQEERSLVN